jgi:isopropylmalate/homocitrate/citramalate synthase
MRLSEEAGIPVKIRLCDTMGYGVTYPGAALPRCVPKIIRAMIDDAGVPSERLEWHGHNDFYKGLINATTAWLYGCSAANGTLLGFGERTGNAPIEGLIMDYISLMGHNNGIDTTVITRCEYCEGTSNRIPRHALCRGHDNATSANYADGILKNEEIIIFSTPPRSSTPISTFNDSRDWRNQQWINSFFLMKRPGGENALGWRGSTGGTKQYEVDEPSRPGGEGGTKVPA